MKKVCKSQSTPAKKPAAPKKRPTMQPASQRPKMQPASRERTEVNPDDVANTLTTYGAMCVRLGQGIQADRDPYYAAVASKGQVKVIAQALFDMAECIP